MRTLAESQARFARRLLAHDTPEPGIAIYRANIRANYRQALRASYPATRKLAGEVRFDALVDRFVAASPPTSGDLNRYGDAFAAFLGSADDEPLPPFVADVASIEWAIDESSRAADVTRSPGRLRAAFAALDAEHASRVRLRLDPSCRLLEARAPAFDAWRSADGPGGFGEESRLEWLLVRRDPEGVLVEKIARAVHGWLFALHRGATFGDALGSAFAIDAAFDLSAALQERIGDGTLAAIAA